MIAAGISGIASGYSPPVALQLRLLGSNAPLVFGYVYLGHSVHLPTCQEPGMGTQQEPKANVSIDWIPGRISPYKATFVRRRVLTYVLCPYPSTYLWSSTIPSAFLYTRLKSHNQQYRESMRSES